MNGVKKIAVFNQKGGVGKTSVTVNLACCLADTFKQRILIVDCDPQAKSTKYLMGEREDEVEDTITDYIEGAKEDYDLLYTVSFEKKVYVDYLTSSGDKTKKVRTIRREVDLIPIRYGAYDADCDGIEYLKDLLSDLEDEYDFCFMDCPADLSYMSANALAAADYVLIPSTPEIDSISGLGLILDTIQSVKDNGTNSNLELLGIVINKTDHGASSMYYTKQLESKDKAFKSKIRTSSDAVNARSFCKPVTFYKNNSNIAHDYRQLAKEVMDRIKKKG